jgi:Indole-3-glycerol phosphate synthase
MNILEQIAKRTKERVAENKGRCSLEQMKKMALSMNTNTGFPFEKALKSSDISFICEVKKASPSKGVIAEVFPYVEIAKSYELAGASAISCLTEPYYFMGRDEYLQEIVKEVSIPVLRKDFVVDAYMIYEAKVLGASAILLICAILTDEKLKEYVKLAKKLGLSVLIEAHTEEEVKRALNSGAKIIGVNNRDLKTFQVDINISICLRELVPRDYVYVSESGITSAEDVANLCRNGTNAVLIGETLMRSENKKEMLLTLKSLC